MEIPGIFSDDESEDEWFFESIKRYEDLLMYDVQGHVSCMCFQDDNTLILAATRGDIHELWEVKLPDKLTAGINAGLVKNRDFTLVAAGYTKNTIHQVVWTGGGVVTSGSGGVDLYTTNDTDVMNLASTLRSDVKDASLAATSATLYSGRTISDVAATDLSSHSTKNLSIKSIENVLDAQVISNISAINDSLFIGLRKRDTVLLYDCTAGKTVLNVGSGNESEGKWSIDVSHEGDKVVLANSTGLLSVYDVRNSNKVVFSTSIPQTDDSLCEPVVHISPTDSLVSLSGSGKLVYVLDFKTGEGGNHSVFTHDGHRDREVKRIVQHLWHPTQENLLFSADDNSKIQAWRFK